MIRTPALKTQVAILVSQLKNQGVTLQHAAALEIVAQQNGFKNWRHASTEAKAVPEAPANKEVFELKVVFGDEDSRKVANGHKNPEKLDTFTHRTFATAAELEAYLEGLEEGNGWLDYAIIEPPAPMDSVADWEGLKGENHPAILALLAKHGFVQSEVQTEFHRYFEGENYQFVLFDYRHGGTDRDEAGPAISMDCINEDGDYITETPLFFGETFEEALTKAMAAADEQLERGKAEVAN